MPQPYLASLRLANLFPVQQHSLKFRGRLSCFAMGFDFEEIVRRSFPVFVLAFVNSHVTFLVQFGNAEFVEAEVAACFGVLQPNNIP
jgi:hypothetical protein